MKAKLLAAVLLLGSGSAVIADDYDGIYTGRPTTRAGGSAECPTPASVSFRVTGSKINFTHDQNHVGKVDQGGRFELSAPGKAPGQLLIIAGQIDGTSIKNGTLTMMGNQVCRFSFEASRQ